MIPVRLQLKNFLPYRGSLPPFTFEGIHLACISGDNGAGKTSIIDAMTWALWGKSRLRSRSTTDEDLITQGESETEVSFDFRAGDGQVYRVIRRRSLPKKSGSAGQSSLSLFLNSPEGLKTISGNTMGETEDKIIKILHLDYETFISTAYLKQGEADHFTGLTAAQRKEVLVSILGLDVYDELAEKAKSRAGEAATAKTLLAQSIELEQRQLEKRPGLEAKLADARQSMQDVETALLEKRAALDRLRAAQELYESRRQALQQVEAMAAEIENDLKLRLAEKRDIEQNIAKHSSVLAGRVEIEEGYGKYLLARREAEDFGRKLAELRRLENRRQSFEKTLVAARHELETKKALWQDKFDELSVKASRLPDLLLTLKSLEIESEKIAAKEEQVEAETSRLQALQVELAAIGAEEAGQARRLTEIVEKIEMLASVGKAAACPVCEAELNEVRLAMVQAKYAAERVSVKARLGELATVKVDKIQEITALELHLALDNSLNTDRAVLGIQKASLLKELAEAESAASRLTEGKKKISEITRQIELGDFAAGDRNGLRALDGEIKQLGYDGAAHEKVVVGMKSLEVFEKGQRELDESGKLLAAERQSLDRTIATAANLEERLAKRLAEVQEQREALAKLATVEPGELAAVEAEVRVLASAASAASENIGSLKQGLAHLAELEERVTVKAVDLKRYTAEESVYTELHRVFGKNGIQGVLIENAVPEMEAEANRLLAKMTDNRMSLKLELQRATKKGELAETFDIKIADELGTRGYDLFSGGEAFRINFALRLALSRLLAYRAGAPLRTLIIDEGFGTQDAAGIEKLKEAIASIQDQFDCILVITHIEEFKDAFPARVEVFKTSVGSKIQVSYN